MNEIYNERAGVGFTWLHVGDVCGVQRWRRADHPPRVATLLHAAAIATNEEWNGNDDSSDDGNNEPWAVDKRQELKDRMSKVLNHEKMCQRGHNIWVRGVNNNRSLRHLHLKYNYSNNFKFQGEWIR